MSVYKEIESNEEIKEIYEELQAKPCLLDFMKKCFALTKEQREQVLQMLTA